MQWERKWLDPDCQTVKLKSWRCFGRSVKRPFVRFRRHFLGKKKRPGYTTVQTMVYRMEAKGVVRRVRKVGNFHIFAPAVSRDAAQRRLVDELLARFGGRSQPVMGHMIELQAH